MNTNLTKKLDDTVSAIVRNRDKQCISCGRRLQYECCDAGHYIPRSHMATRFDLRNVNAQCIECNRFKAGNIEAYREALVLKIGENEVRELENAKRRIVKYSDRELRELLTDLKQNLKLYE